MSQFLTRAELASAVGLSMETIRRLTAANKIPFYRIGRSYRYELEPVLDTFKNEAAPDADKAQKTALLG
jgi:excisionase family DNA binding protein